MPDENQFGLSELDLWNETVLKGRLTFKQWFERLSHDEQRCVMTYLALLQDNQ